MHFPSKQGFYEILKETLMQNVCSTEESLTRAFNMSIEILQSGATLKICSLKFKAKVPIKRHLATKVKPKNTMVKQKYI